MTCGFIVDGFFRCIVWITFCNLHNKMNINKSMTILIDIQTIWVCSNQLLTWAWVFPFVRQHCSPGVWGVQSSSQDQPFRPPKGWILSFEFLSVHAAIDSFLELVALLLLTGRCVVLWTAALSGEPTREVPSDWYPNRNSGIVLHKMSNSGDILYPKVLCCLSPFQPEWGWVPWNQSKSTELPAHSLLTLPDGSGPSTEAVHWASCCVPKYQRSYICQDGVNNCLKVCFWSIFSKIMIIVLVT